MPDFDYGETADWYPEPTPAPEEAPSPVEHNLLDELGIAQHILALRTYDVLVAILRNFNADEAEALVKFHEAGGTLSPTIAYRPE